MTGGSSAAIVVASGGTLEIDDLAGVVSGSQTQNFNAPIRGFASGDTLKLEGFGQFATINGTSASYDASTDTTSLTLTDNGSTVATLDLAGGNYTNATVIPDPHVDGGVDVALICFCVNTQILTPSGERPVQYLAVGDEVLTHSGEARHVTWIGTGKVLASRGRRNGATPVIVRRGALADNLPSRDVHVTKGHALYLDGALIPVEYLVNHRSILWDDREQESSCTTLSWKRMTF